jgi:two-component system, OmpR family, response regulator
VRSLPFYFFKETIENVHRILITPRLYPLESFQSSHLLVEHISENKAANSVQTAETAHSIKPNKSPELWWFNAEERTLLNPGKKISLTRIESLLLKQLALSESRVCSKTELIHGINRDPERYRGLEMCLSRLQEKFTNTANGERLFRSVRNRGYCLVQKVRVPDRNESAG